MADTDETSGLEPNYQRDIVDVLLAVSGEDGDHLDWPAAKKAADVIRELRCIVRQRWVPVAEREPEADRRVLVMMPQGFVMIATRVVLGEPYDPKYHGVVEWANEEDEWLIHRPVKWMPLPEATP